MIKLKTEAQIKNLVKEYLKSLGDKCCWFMPAANMYGRAGVSDFIVCFIGKFVAIECKAEGKRNNTSSLQKKFLDDVVVAGGSAWVVSCEDDMRSKAVILEGWIAFDRTLQVHMKARGA